MKTRLIYVDDSGAEATGWVVYGWVEVLIEDWKPGLRKWLDMRKSLFATYQIPPSYELHATRFVNGRGNPSTNDQWNREKHRRSSVIEEALDSIADCDEFSVGSVYRQTSARRHDYFLEQGSVYDTLISHWDAEAIRKGEHVMVFMDGDGTAASYYNAHRGLSLASRNVIEDPLFVPAHRSQWIQIADLIAYTSYISLLRPPSKKFAWDWYARLRSCDVNQGPIAI